MGARHVKFDQFAKVHREVSLRVLGQCGLDEPKALQIAERLLSDLARELGGSKVYIGAAGVRTAHRRARVLALAGEGLRAGYIAARLGISEPTVYRILSASAAGRK